MRTVLFSIFSFLVLFLFGCSNSNSVDSEPLTEALSADQKATFYDVFRSAGAIFGATKMVGRDSLGLKLFAVETSPQSDLAKQMGGGRCSVGSNRPPVQGTPGYPLWHLGNLYPTINVWANGGDCPLNLAVMMATKVSHDTIETKLDANYQTRTDSVRAVNDVTEFDFHGEGKISGDPQGPEVVYDASGDAKGYLISQKVGKVELWYGVKANFTKSTAYSAYGNFKMVMRAKFPSFTVELREVGNFSGGNYPNSTYTMNGLTVGRQSFYSVIPLVSP